MVTCLSEKFRHKMVSMKMSRQALYIVFLTIKQFYLV